MFEQDVVQPGYIFGYILSLLALSWGILILSAFGFIPPLSLGIIPFIPGILALLFLSLEGHPIEVHAWPLLRPVTIPAIIFAVVYPFILIGLAAFVALGTGLGYLNSGAGTGYPCGVDPRRICVHLRNPGIPRAGVRVQGIPPPGPHLLAGTGSRHPLGRHRLGPCDGPCLLPCPLYPGLGRPLSYRNSRRFSSRLRSPSPSPAVTTSPRTSSPSLS